MILAFIPVLGNNAVLLRISLYTFIKAEFQRQFTRTEYDVTDTSKRHRSLERFGYILLT